MNNIDLAWLAGIFEGEGTACMSPCYSGNGKRCGDRIVMAIPQKHREMLEEVKRITNTGSIHEQPSWDGFQWVCACRAARTVLAALVPYLRTPQKRKQVGSALETDAANRLNAKMKLSNLRRRANYAKVS